MALTRRAFTALGLALAAAPAHAQQLDKVSFGTNWVAEAEHGGFYQAVADGTYKKYGLDVTIVPGGPQVNNRMLLLAGQDRLLHERELAAGLRRGRAEHPDHRGGGELPEGSAGAARASGSGFREVRGPEERDAARLVRGPADLFQMDAGRVRLQRREGEALHVQSAAVSGRQEERDAGLRDVRAVRGREGRREAEDLPARRPRLQHLLDLDRNAPRDGGEAARPGAALRRCLGDRLVQLSLRRQQGRERADPQAQSGNDARS